MKNEQYIMALDQGTTSSRCILFDHQGNRVSTASQEFSQHYPKPGWVEHDPMEIFASQLGVASRAMNQIGIGPSEIAAIGITNQRETTIVWDKETGEPVYPAIVWQCRRTSDYCDSLKAKGLTDTFRQKTGLVIDAYFSGKDSARIAGCPSTARATGPIPTCWLSAWSAGARNSTTHN